MKIDPRIHIQPESLTLAAGEYRKLDISGSFFLLVSNSVVGTKVKGAIGADSYSDWIVGYSFETSRPEDFFSCVKLYNPSLVSMTVEYIIAMGGRVTNQNATVSGVVTVDDTPNALASGLSIVALPVSGILIDAAAAVDKGGGLVGIPVAAQPFTAGENVTLAGTVNYNGPFAVDATSSVNEVVIAAAYVAEVFAGTETINLTAPRSIPASAARKALDVHNHNTTTDLWYGDSSVDPANYKGVPITPGNGLWIPGSEQVYFAAPVAAGKTGVRLSYVSHSKT